MSAQKDLVFTRFRKVGKTIVRLNEEDANEFALAIQSCFGQLMGFGSICIEPNALSSKVTESVLRRWLLAAPDLIPVTQVLSAHPGELDQIKQINSVTLIQFNTRIFKIAMEQGQLHEEDAREFAFHLTESASAFFALYQACMGCEDRLLKDLTTRLRNALSEPLDHVIAARALYFGEIST